MNRSSAYIRKLPHTAICFALLVSMFTGCGFNRLDPLLPDTLDGLTLAEIRAIQQDRSLTNAERQEAIREAIGAPDTPDGDRLVNFLLNLNIQ